MKNLAVSCLFAIFAGGGAIAAADYQAGLDAYAEGDYDRAFYEWMQVADSPESDVHPEILAETFYALGMLFWVGQGVQQDTAESALWLRKAAELDHPGAQVKLGFLYSSGQGVPHSDFEAMKWLMMAARQGDADAQYNLGVVYRDGLGVAVDADKSLQWFREAAANGDSVSARIVEEMESSADSSIMPATTASQQVVQAPPPSVPGTSARTGTPVNPESPWWVDVHGIPIEAAEDPVAAATPLPEAEVTVPRPNSVSEEPRLPPDEQAVQAGVNDAAWLRERDPERYTIQVIALLDVEKLQTFMARHADWAPFAIYEQEWKGKPLWVLVQGDYPDVMHAREAVRKFPTDIQKRDNLWIRKFVMVQGVLK